MKFLALVFLAIVAVAFSFSPRVNSRISPRSLAMKKDLFPSKIVIPTAALSILAPVAAFAAEGTGRAFGIDDGRLVWAALLPSFLIFPLYLQWSSQQDKDDFFDGYEKRRSG